MSLEDKIKAILGEAKVDEAKGDALKALGDLVDGSEDDKTSDDQEDKDQDSDDQDSDKDQDSDDQDSDKDQDDTKSKKTAVSQDSGKTDKAEVKEDVTSVPGTGKSLIDAKEQLSGSEKTSKMTAKYNKGTKQEKLTPEGQGGSTDAKAAEETAKIKAKYETPAMEKLKAESFEALFSGETLTEEFQTKAKAIFEAAVAQVAEAKVEALQEEYQLKLDEAVEEVKGELVEQIDGYLDHVVEEWMQDNAVALESGIKVEMVSSFMESLKDVFTQHYIEVPESKVDVVEEQAAAIEELQLKLAEAEEIAEAALIESKVLKAEAIIAEAQEGLTQVQAEKLYSLAENVDFETEEEFAAKVNALRESYFRKDAKTATQEEKQPAQIEESKSYSDVEAVLQALRQDSKLIRSSN